MQKEIIYNEFIESSKISHNNSIDNFFDGIKYLIENGSDIISYNTTKNISLSNDVLIDNTFIYSIEREADIIENIHFVSTDKNIIMTFIIGDNEYDNINTFIYVSSMYNEFKLKFTFTEKPNLDDKIYISYKNYLLNVNERNNFIKNVVKTNTNIYSDGICSSLL